MNNDAIFCHIGRRGTGLALQFCLACLVACTAETADPGDQASQPDVADSSSPTVSGAGEPMPAIYVDQRVVNRSFDRQGDYQYKLDLCQQLPDVTVRALSAEEFAKIGVTRVQRWIKADKAALRWERFDFGQRGERCHFYLVSEGTHGYYDATRTVSISLDDNERSVSEPIRAYRLARESHLSLEQALARKMERLETLPVTGPPEMQSAAGAPCLLWHSSVGMGDFCVWAGGTQWTFNIWSGGPLHGDFHLGMLSSIILRQEPGPKNPETITTQEFTVGADFGESDMMPKPATTSYPGKEQ